MPIKKSAPLAKKLAAPNTDTLITEAKEFINNQAEIKRLTDINNKLKESLRKSTTEIGDKVPESGSFNLVLKTADEEITLKNTCRTGVSINASALDVIKSELPELQDALIEQVEVLRTDKLEIMLDQDELTVEQAKKLVTETTSYAFSATKKKVK